MVVVVLQVLARFWERQKEEVKLVSCLGRALAIAKTYGHEVLEGADGLCLDQGGGQDDLLHIVSNAKTIIGEIYSDELLAAWHEEGGPFFTVEGYDRAIDRNPHLLGPPWMGSEVEEEEEEEDFRNELLLLRSELEALKSQVYETQISQAASQQPNVRLSVGAPPVAGGVGNAPFDDLAEEQGEQTPGPGVSKLHDDALSGQGLSAVVADRNARLQQLLQRLQELELQATLAFPAHEGTEEVGWELLAAGCDTDKAISVGATTLHLAAAAGRVGVVPGESCSGKGSGASKKKKKKSKK
jgi:hypothetical protein